MNFKNFKIQVLIRLSGILILMFSMIILFVNGKLISSSISLMFLILSVVILYQYITSIIHKLTNFFDAVRFDDFVISFEDDNRLGQSFSRLNNSMKSVIKAFHKTRVEKETQFRFLDSIVNHVKVGLIVFDDSEQVVLINPMCLDLLGISKIKKLGQLANYSNDMYKVIKKTAPDLNQLFFQG